MQTKRRAFFYYSNFFYYNFLITFYINIKNELNVLDFCSMNYSINKKS